MPSASASVADDPRFAVQVANEGTWDAATGVNDLGQQIVVAAEAAVPPTAAPTAPGAVAPPVAVEPVVDPTVVDGAAAFTPTRGALAATGTDQAPLGVVALGMLVLGAAGAFLARRRTTPIRSTPDQG